MQRGLVLVIYSGVLFFSWRPTHPPCKDFSLTRIASHLNDGGRWVVLVFVGSTSPRTIRRTHQTACPRTHTHLPNTHPATMQGFCAVGHRFTVEAIPRLLL